MSKNEQDLFSRFEKLYWHLSRNMGYIWKKIFEQHLPGSQSHLLFMLERSGPKRMSELADSLHLTPGAVTIASDKLIHLGYIDRIRDENDRRVVYLNITDKGHQKMEELRIEGKRVMLAVFSHLSETDLKHLIAVFEQASDNVKNLQSGCEQ